MTSRRNVGTPGTNGSGANDRMPSNSWKIIGIVCSVLVTGIPAAITLLQGHEMACRSTSVWQRFAGFFGDCSAYDQKQAGSGQSPDVAGGSLKMLPRSEQLKIARDRIADSLPSRAEQDKLYAEGLRIGANEVCYLIDYRKLTPDAISILERFSTEPIVCSGKQAPLHLMTKEQGCWRNANFSSDGPIVLADRWNGVRPSTQLREWALQQLKAYRAAESAKPSDLAQLCSKRHGDGAEKLSAEERSFIDAVFAFTPSCRVERLQVFGLPVFSYVGLSHSEWGTGNVSDLCRSKTQKSGIDNQALQIREYLLRWSKG